MRKFIFKIILKDTKPLIWRKFEVRDNISFYKFHEVIQIIMGWGNYQFFKFESPDCIIDGENYEEYDEKKLLNSRSMKIKDYFTYIGNKIEYIYDFSDYWEHDIILENILESKDLHTICLEGKRACPPEDCGGTIEFEDCLIAYKLKKEGKKALNNGILMDEIYLENLKEISEWIGDWDPESFDINSVNNLLKEKKI